MSDAYVVLKNHTNVRLYASDPSASMGTKYHSPSLEEVNTERELSVMMLCSPTLMNRLLEEMSSLKRGLKVLQSDLDENWGILETLKAENKKYRDVLTVLPQPFFMKDESLCYVLCSMKFASTLRKTVDEIIGKFDEEIVPAELANMRRQQEMRILKSCQAEETEEFLTIDGKQKVFMTLRAPLQNGNGCASGIFGISVDISTYWRKMVELKNLNRQMESMLAGQSQQIESLHNNLEHVLSAMKKQEAEYRDLRVDYEKHLSMHNAEHERLRSELQKQTAERKHVAHKLLTKVSNLHDFVASTKKFLNSPGKAN